ncbi:MAG: alpha/beta hydrolase [Polaromonas sp.]|nr:alpha/beta hydrolase [Polaromonas sp.]
MFQPSLRTFITAGLAAMSLLMLGTTPTIAQGAERIGVLMLHGKSPGSNQDQNLGQLKPLLEREGWLVAFPDMPWSRGRFIDGNWDKAMAEIGAQVQTLRSQGATRIVVMGHSLGVPAAMSYAARGGDVQALVLMAPGHVPATFYNVHPNKVIRQSVDEARALIAAGKGDSRERFSDINQGRQANVVATASDYLSYFDPASDADMGNTAARIPATTPVLTVVGDADVIFKHARAYFADKLPANPKSQYLEVQANHLTTPGVAGAQAIVWIRTALAP